MAVTLLLKYFFNRTYLNYSFESTLRVHYTFFLLSLRFAVFYLETQK